MMLLCSIFTLLPLIVILANAENLRKCAVMYSKDARFSTDDEETSSLHTNAKNGVVQCKYERSKCYTLWRYNKKAENTTLISIIAQGCWEVSGEDECSGNKCLEKVRLKQNAIFCCCSTNMCNNITLLDPLQYFKHNNNPTTEQPSITTLCKNCSNMFQRFKIVYICAIAFLFSTIFITYFIYKWVRHHMLINKYNLPQNKININKTCLELPRTQLNSHMTSMNQIVLEQVIGQGRYGIVWLGKKKDELVAVKLFPTNYHHYYCNEKDIYTLPFIEHSSLLTLIGWDDYYVKDGFTYLALIVNYCSNGNLQDYLIQHTLDLVTFCNMSLSIIKGLAHLHTEIRSEDQWKPCISHRDINTKNILVKSDLTCCLCDLGLATKITGAKYFTLNEEQNAETKSIHDVGTLRYMAPEVLEGAVNLRDCESSLKQIDIYAFGLVLWELAVRTIEFYENINDMPNYMLPFEKEVGNNPSLELMQVIVTRKKSRPSFPTQWSDSTDAAKLIRETIEDCTDADAEARLTALCVQERLISLTRASSSPLDSVIMCNNSTFVESVLNNMVLGESIRSDITEDTMETVVTISPSDPYNSNQLYDSNLSVLPLQQDIHFSKNLLMDRSDEVCVEISSKDNRRKNNSHNLDEREWLLCPTSSISIYSAKPTQFCKNKSFHRPDTPIKTTTKNSASFLSKPIKKLLQYRKESSDSVSNHGKTIKTDRPSSLQLVSIKVNEKHNENDKQLQHLSNRVKTPGDLPPSVRKKRARLSLYDDSIMICKNKSNDSTF